MKNVYSYNVFVENFLIKLLKNKVNSTVHFCTFDLINQILLYYV